MTGPDPTLVLLDRYGMWVVVLWLLWRDIWPWFSAKVWPERRANVNQERRRLVDLEERQVRAMEQTASAVVAIQQTMTGMDIRLGQIEKGQGCIDQALTDHEKHTRGQLAILVERKERRNA